MLSNPYLVEQVALRVRQIVTKRLGIRLDRLRAKRSFVSMVFSDDCPEPVLATAIFSVFPPRRRGENASLRVGHLTDEEAERERIAVAIASDSAGWVLERPRDSPL